MTEAPVNIEPELQRGFTMIESMIVLAIVGVLVVMAAPSLKRFVQGNQVASTTNTFVHSLQAGRSEAIKRGLPAGICTTSAPLADGAGCDESAGWTDGWLVYVDTDRNGQRDASEEVVLRAEARMPVFSFTADPVFAHQIYFDETGGSSNIVGIPLQGSVNINYGGGELLREVEVRANGRISSKVIK